MKVALFTDTYLPQINGVTNTLKHLVQYYAEQGIEYRIYSPDYYKGSRARGETQSQTQHRTQNEVLNKAPNVVRYPTQPPDQTPAQYDVHDHWVEKFHSLKLFLYPECRLAFPNPFRLNASIAGFRPDLIHLMTEWNMGFAGLQLGKRFGIPTVSNYTTNFTQYTSYYKADFLKQPVWDYLKWFHNQNSVTLCPSNEARQFIQVHGIENTALFSRGIDITRFHPSLRSPDFKEKYNLQETFTFLYVGRVSPEKDLDLLNTSYRALKIRYGDAISLVITGDGPSLEKLKNQFPNDVVFTGFKTGRDVAEVYASADAFVCPSSTETFGNVILEAMASGLPVIGADAGGVREIIQQGENGLLFKARDAHDLEKAMEKLFVNGALRTSLISKGIETAENRSWERVFSELMNVYDTLLKSEIQCEISA